MSNKKQFLGAIRHHDSTWHDGGVAIATPAGEVYALASERVGMRYRHYWDSRPAYEYMRDRMNSRRPFGSEDDSFRSGSVHQDGCAQEHHLYHASSVFWASPFSTAAILVADGQGHHGGQTVSTTTWRGTRKLITSVE